MYYRPILPNGKIAPIAWQIKLFFLNICWPIKDNATLIIRCIDKFMLVAGFVMFSVINAAECYYVVDKVHDIGKMLEGLATYLILIEMHLRIFSMAMRKDEFKKFIAEFYQKIYIEHNGNREMYANIQRRLLPTILYSYSYIGTLLTYFAIPLIGFYTNQRLLPYKMLFPYDYTPWYIYIPTLLVCLWIGVAVVSAIIAESNTLAMLILHLNARYTMQQQEMSKLYSTLKRSESNNNHRLLSKFQQHLIEIIQRNVELNAFAAKLQAQYAFRIFVMMGLSAVLLCVLGFKAVTLGTTSENISYICWIGAKILELTVFGSLGSQLKFTTNDLSSMYYSSNWEDVILHSSHTQQNIHLMKLIALAIELNQKPFSLSGFNFFTVSLESVLGILQGAGSYLTCLMAIR